MSSPDIPKTQKALVISAIGTPFEVKEREVPAVKEGHVLVRIEAVGLNPIEWKIRKIGFPGIPVQFPLVLGCDTAGVVVAKCPTVEKYKIGDRVVWQAVPISNNDFSGFQQYALADAAHITRLPSNISFVQAATLPSGVMTASAAFYSATSFNFPRPWAPGFTSSFKDEPIVIIGGSSIMGTVAIQFAKMQEFGEIIVTSSLQHAQYLKSLGATHVVDRTQSTSEIAAQITSLAPSIKYVYDCIAEDDTPLIDAAITRDSAESKLVLVRRLRTKAEGGPDLDMGSRTVLGVRGLIASELELGKETFGELGKWLESGAVKPTNLEILEGGLAGIPDGLDRLEAGKVSGKKLVALPPQTE